MAQLVTDKGSFDINTICIMSLQISIWKCGIDEQQKKLANACHASLNVKHQEDVIDPVTTTVDNNSLFTHDFNDLQPTMICIVNAPHDNINVKKFDDIVNDIALNWKLNEMQVLAFQITATQFWHILQHGHEKE